MKKEKMKIIIEGFIMISLFICSVLTFIDNPTLGVINIEDPDYMKFDVPPEEEILENEEILEDKEKEDFYKEFKR